MPFLLLCLLVAFDCNDCINSYKFNCYSVAIAFCKIIACLNQVTVLITALKERVSSAAAGSLEFFPFDLEPAQQDQLVTVRYYDSILIPNPNVINY